jgi:hypothetical protein
VVEADLAGAFSDVAIIAFAICSTSHLQAHGTGTCSVCTISPVVGGCQAHPGSEDNAKKVLAVVGLNIQAGVPGSSNFVQRRRLSSQRVASNLD